MKKGVKHEQITAENIHKHRKAILKNGRKFKFPVQYLQHRVIINTILISLGVLVAVSGVSFWQLYFMRNTGDVLYGVTRIFPLPAGQIDGHSVRLSDYLAFFRSSVMLIEWQEGELPNTPESAERLAELRREAMYRALENALALGFAREMGITVSEEEIERELVAQRNITGTEVSEASFGLIIRNNYGMSLTEYRRLFVELPLIRSRVIVALDTVANETLRETRRLLDEGRSFSEIAAELGDYISHETSGGEIPLLSLDGGRTLRANGMEIGETSESFLSWTSDAFYFVRTTGRSDGRIAYESLTIPLEAFIERFNRLIEDEQFEKFVRL